MKKILSFLLALCMLIPLAVTPGFAAVGSAEEFEQLKQRAEGGEAAAMAEIGNTYYMGSYGAGVDRDFSQALAWFLRAADAGDTSVCMNIANIYEKGSTGERSYEKAYDWFRRAAELGSKEAEERMAAPVYAALRWKDNSTALEGQLGEYGNLGGRYGTPFYLDKPVLDCSMITLQMSFIQYRGWPFGLYGLFAQTLNGDWVEVDRFQIEKYGAGRGAPGGRHGLQPRPCGYLLRGQDLPGRVFRYRPPGRVHALGQGVSRERRLLQLRGLRQSLPRGIHRLIHQTGSASPRGRRCPVKQKNTQKQENLYLTSHFGCAIVWITCRMRGFLFVRIFQNGRTALRPHREAMPAPHGAGK